MESGRHPLSFREKVLYHQIHPAKASTDLAAGLLSTYLMWVHQLILGILGGFVPAIVASVLVVRYADLKKYASSPLGRYVRRYMTRTMEAVRLAGLLLSWLRAWYNLFWVIGVGVLIVVLAWLGGK